MTEFEKRIIKDFCDECHLSTDCAVDNDKYNCAWLEWVLEYIKREIKKAFNELPEGFVNTYKSSGVALSEFIYEIFMDRGIE